MKVAPFRSLRFKLIASVVVIEVLMLSIMVWNNVETIYRTHTDRLADTGQRLTQQFANIAGGYMVEVDYASLEDYASSIIGHGEVTYILVLTPNGQAVIRLGVKNDRIPEPDPHPAQVTDGVFDVAADISLAGRYQGRVLVGFSLELMHQTISQALNRSIAIAITEIILSIIVTVMLGVYLTRNLRVLTETAARVGKGQYDTIPITDNKDEIGLTVLAFNKMVKGIAERTRRIEESQAQISLLMNSTAEAIVGIDQERRCMFVNPACLGMIGYTDASEVIGKDFHDLTHHSHADGSHYPAEDCAIRRNMESTAHGHTVGEIFWRKDGTSFPIEAWTHPILKNGEIAGYMMTFIDITKRVKTETELHEYRNHLEDLVEQRTSELTNINQELESFSYSVSHDLRTPLRHIDGFSLVLQEDYAEKLGKEGQELLSRIRAGSQNMGQLIDDLLKLSQVSRGQIQREPLNLSSMAEDIINKLQRYNADRKISIVIKPELMANADHRLTHVLLENLIGNAWKYTAKTDNASITFDETHDKNGNPVFCLRDNGAGFDMEYAEKLFTAFKRLHTEKEFEGTGIGLATVQRIINRHSGRIWAEAKTGEGAAFYFSFGD
ncbi:MAG: PAS domain S-box protein [Gammaproteobacteria bacterium]|nr:PAS domain S-box protein [Gammaproteobacteria bacterium]